MNFKNKVVLITGGSSGIGAATAILFAKEGAYVTIVGRNEGKLKEVAKQIELNGKKPLVITADVTKEQEVTQMVNKTVEVFGKLDVLVNNAGTIQYESLAGEKILEVFDKVMNTNLRSVLHVTKLAVPHLVESKGNIVNVSSILGEIVMPLSPNFLSYSISKAALNHFTRCIACELSTTGIRVNAVSPGPVNNEFLNGYDSTFKAKDLGCYTALNRISESEDIGDIILFLSSDKAKSITGTIIICDNGAIIKR